MDRFELYEALRAAGVPEAYYEIPGHPGGPHPVDRYFLEEREGAWVVGIHERDRREVLERFGDEHAACAWLHARLTDEGPLPEPATAEELEALLHDGEAVRRRAREDLERALAEARRRSPGHPGPADGRTA
ncbi:hypothetical protein AB0953_04390 [Streptomyces sp. NPDC046866]|uniref:hypothetical protein n=1 Tax=Streptomyces sp. NPDC046866 TaxID=3154921 RepID=UPI003451FD7E